MTARSRDAAPPFRARKCGRCSGSGLSPVEAGKFCKRCYGAGVTSRSFNYRSDGRVERACRHGVGHTVCARAGGDFVHGCDGCCGAFARYFAEESK